MSWRRVAYLNLINVFAFALSTKPLLKCVSLLCYKSKYICLDIEFKFKMYLFMFFKKHKYI